MKLSIVLPIQNESACIEKVLGDIIVELKKEQIDYEMVAVNDNSRDNTLKILKNIAQKNSCIKIINRLPPAGFGRAVKEGIANAKGDFVAIVMGDGSDDPVDIVKYYRKLNEGFDCVFGSRFNRDSVVKDYPSLKFLINRLANTFIRMLFLIKFNDITNAFKAYRREVLTAITPLQALHFNITVEIPLKAIVRGYSYATLPINWYGRTSGVSKLKIRQMGRKYLFTVLYIWLEKLLLQDELPKKISVK